MSQSETLPSLEPAASQCVVCALWSRRWETVAEGAGMVASAELCRDSLLDEITV